jgi:hypothetical protein
MKRYNLTEASIAPCYLSWSIIFFLLVLSIFSCACKNKITNDQLNSQVETAPVVTQQDTLSNSQNQYTAPEVLESSYHQIVKTIKDKPGYSYFGEFMERGSYTTALMRMDIMEYYLLVPDDSEIKKMDNATFTQLIYPEVSNQTNINFLYNHLAFSPKEKGHYRTMIGKSVSFESNSKNITIDGRQYPVIDEVSLPSVKVIFIDNYLN